MKTLFKIFRPAVCLALLIAAAGMPTATAQSAQGTLPGVKMTLTIPKQFHIEYRYKSWEDTYLVVRDYDEWTEGVALSHIKEFNGQHGVTHVSAKTGYMYIYYPGAHPWHYLTDYGTPAEYLGKWFDPMDKPWWMEGVDYGFIHLPEEMLSFGKSHNGFDNVEYVRPVGKETVAGVECYVYKERLGITYWVDPKTGLTLKYTDPEDPEMDFWVTLFHIGPPEWNFFLRPDKYNAIEDITGGHIWAPARPPYRNPNR